jgi:hypothetical protein
MSTRYCTEVTPECPVEYTTYGYYPNLGGNIVLLVVFAICFFAQIVIGWKTKVRAFTTVVAIGCGLEAIGYGGRLMMNENPWSQDGFKMQVCCLILAPSFLAAGFYLSIKHIILYLGKESSRLAPRWYTWAVCIISAGSCLFGTAIRHTNTISSSSAATSSPSSHKQPAVESPRRQRWATTFSTSEMD